MTKKDYFDLENQLGARLKGNYHSIAESVGKCVFCDLRDKYIIKRLKGWVLTVNIFPYIDGQLLTIPERHIENFEDMTTDDVLVNNRLTWDGIKLLKNKLDIKNYWIIIRQGEIAGKTVKHLHGNIMPYVEGLNTWHYQEIKISPLNLAELLRGKNEGT